MDTSMFTGFEGRINRAKWWIGSIILAVISVILYLILAAIFGPSVLSIPDPSQMGSVMRSIAIIQLIILAIMAYPITALWIKRLNDRDRPSYLVYVFWTPTVLSVLVALFGLTMTTVDVGGVVMPVQSGLGWILSLAVLAIGVWALVEMGILKGTDGPNRHGPNPLVN